MGDKFHIDGIDGLDFDEQSNLGSNLFYSWISDYEYMEGLFKIGSLLIGTSIPNILERYVDQARKCYALQQYLSVYALCRTILEISVRDIGQRKGRLPRDKVKVKHTELRKLHYMKNKVVPKFLKGDAGRIYDRTSGLIHGRKTIGKEDAYDMFKRTLELVQKLYDYYFSSKGYKLLKR